MKYSMTQEAYERGNYNEELDSELLADMKNLKN